MLPRRIEVEQTLVFLSNMRHCLIEKDYKVSEEVRGMHFKIFCV